MRDERYTVLQTWILCHLPIPRTRTDGCGGSKACYTADSSWVDLALITSQRIPGLLQTG